MISLFGRARRRLGRFFHSAVTGYVIFAVLLGGVYLRDNQRICHAQEKAWDSNKALADQLTEHASLPKGVGITGLTESGLAQAIANGNLRKDKELKTLTRVRGERPTCSWG